MIGSYVLGGFVFLMSDSMFSAAFDVLIKISKSYQPQILSLISKYMFQIFVFVEYLIRLLIS